MIAIVIKIRLEELLEEKNKTLYAVSKETGIAYNALSKIKKNQVQSMTFDVLEKLCVNLDCTPNDLLVLEK